MVALHPLPDHLPADVLRLGQHPLERGRIGRRFVRGHPRGPLLGLLRRTAEDAPRRRRVPRGAQVDIDDLAVLINGAIGILPQPVHTDIRLVHRPGATYWVAITARRVVVEGREALHPAIDRRRINTHTALHQELSRLDVGQTVAYVPRGGQGDDVGGELMTGEVIP